MSYTVFRREDELCHVTENLNVQCLISERLCWSEMPRCLYAPGLLSCLAPLGLHKPPLFVATPSPCL